MSTFLLSIRELEFYAYHGFTEEERRLGCRYFVNADAHISAHVLETDKPQDTVDYNELMAAIETYATSASTWTLEALAKEIALRILSLFETIESFEIEIGKPLPPAPFVVKSVSVRYKASREVK